MVETARNGAEALAVFNADGDIGLVISDMNMPGMDGLELLARLRQTGRMVPFILLTGDQIPGKSVHPEVDLCLLKDENVPEVIVEAVEKLLGGGGR